MNAATGRLFKVHTERPWNGTHYSLTTPLTTATPWLDYITIANTISMYSTPTFFLHNNMYLAEAALPLICVAAATAGHLVQRPVSAID